VDCDFGNDRFGGLVMVILGIVGDYLPGKTSENWILFGEASFKKVDEDELSLVRRDPHHRRGLHQPSSTSTIFAKKSDIDEERALTETAAFASHLAKRSGHPSSCCSAGRNGSCFHSGEERLRRSLNLLTMVGRFFVDEKREDFFLRRYLFIYRTE
jgi:hypothetical protein